MVWGLRKFERQVLAILPVLLVIASCSTQRSSSKSDDDSQSSETQAKLLLGEQLSDSLQADLAISNQAASYIVGEGYIATNNALGVAADNVELHLNDASSFIEIASLFTAGVIGCLDNEISEIGSDQLMQAVGIISASNSIALREISENENIPIGDLVGPMVASSLESLSDAGIEVEDYGDFAKVIASGVMQINDESLVSELSESIAESMMIGLGNLPGLTVGDYDEIMQNATAGIMIGVSNIDGIDGASYASAAEFASHGIMSGAAAAEVNSNWYSMIVEGSCAGMMDGISEIDNFDFDNHLSLITSATSAGYMYGANNIEMDPNMFSDLAGSLSVGFVNALSSVEGFDTSLLVSVAESVSSGLFEGLSGFDPVAAGIDISALLSSATEELTGAMGAYFENVDMTAVESAITDGAQSSSSIEGYDASEIDSAVSDGASAGQAMADAMMECYSAGDYWDSVYNVCTSPPETTESSSGSETGSTTDGESSTNSSGGSSSDYQAYYAQYCADNGGTWENGTCNYSAGGSPSPSPSPTYTYSY